MEWPAREWGCFWVGCIAFDCTLLRYSGQDCSIKPSIDDLTTRTLNIAEGWLSSETHLTLQSMNHITSFVAASLAFLQHQHLCLLLLQLVVQLSD